MYSFSIVLYVGVLLDGIGWTVGRALLAGVATLFGFARLASTVVSPLVAHVSSARYFLHGNRATSVTGEVLPCLAHASLASLGMLIL